MEKEFFKKLILANYIDMIKRKDIAAINEFLNDSKEITSFLYVLGASEEMMSMPAHREETEKALKAIVSSTLAAIRDGETDLEVRYLDHGIITNTESSKYQERYKLEFGDDIYAFEVARNVGEKSKKIKGSVEKELIASYTKYESTSWPVQTLDTLSQKQLDKAGFVISETIKSTDKDKTIKRDGIKNFVDDSKKGIAWNGSPYELNDQPVSVAEFQNNMCHTISKYPKTKEYYENIVGKDIVEKVIKCLEKRGEKS